jgi:hypothetical protein
MLVTLDFLVDNADCCLLIAKLSEHDICYPQPITIVQANCVGSSWKSMVPGHPTVQRRYEWVILMTCRSGYPYPIC